MDSNGAYEPWDEWCDGTRERTRSPPGLWLPPCELFGMYPPGYSSTNTSAPLVAASRPQNLLYDMVVSARDDSLLLVGVGL